MGRSHQGKSGGDQFRSSLIDLSTLDDEQIRAELYGKIVLNGMKAVVQGNVIEFIEEIGPFIRELLRTREGARGLVQTFFKYLFQTSSQEKNSIKPYLNQLAPKQENK